jgi:phenylacetate-coenzyme A ligase PaaK-like adenylate-forming protein
MRLAKKTVEQRRGAHLAYLNSIMPLLLGRLPWSRAAIEDHQTRAFRDLLRHVRTHSPWHAARVADLDAETATVADLSRLPIMTKADLMDNWDAIVTVQGANRREAEEALRTMTDQFYIWGDHVLLASGGSGGRPGLFLYDWHAMALLWGGMARGFYGSLAPLARQGIELPNGLRMAAIAAEKSAHGSYVLNRIFSNPQNPTHQLSGWRSSNEIIAKLNAIQPHFILCYPSLVQELAAATKAGELTIAPRVVYLGAEHLPNSIRDIARETWPGADILTCWGTSEGGGTFPCPLGDGYHVCEDLVIIEPVDSAGRPVAPGQRSAGIYFTNLFNKALPIIRYYIDDIFEMADGPCACGSSFAKVWQVHGRTLDNFQYGSISVLPAVMELAVLEQPNVIEYQIRQTLRGAHLAYRSEGQIDEARMSSKMRDALLSHGLPEPEITIEHTARFERTTAGKLRRYVPLSRG